MKRELIIRQANYERLHKAREAQEQLWQARLRHISNLQKVLMHRMIQLDSEYTAKFVCLEHFRQLANGILRVGLFR